MFKGGAVGLESAADGGVKRTVQKVHLDVWKGVGPVMLKCPVGCGALAFSSRG